MCYKSRFLIGFSLAILFMSASFPVQAMEEVGREKERNGSPRKAQKKEKKKKSSSGKGQKSQAEKKNSTFKRLIPSVKATRARRDSRQKRALESNQVKSQEKHLQDVVKSKSVKLKTDSIEMLRKVQEQNQISKNEIEFLTNQEQHLHILGEAITQSATQKVEIYSPFVSKCFIKNTLMPWVNSSEKPLHVFIYSTTLGLKKLEKVVGCEDPRFDEQHTLSVARLDSGSNVLIAGDLAMVTSYPLLTFPHEDRKSSLLAGTVFRRRQAQSIIEKIRGQLEIAHKESHDDLRDGSLAEALVVELKESADPDICSPYSGRKHNNSGGSIRGRLRAQSGSSGGSDYNEEEFQNNKKRIELNGSGTFGTHHLKDSSSDDSSLGGKEEDIGNSDGSDCDNDEVIYE